LHLFADFNMRAVWGTKAPTKQTGQFKSRHAGKRLKYQV
jgi:hypothetical protein